MTRAEQTAAFRRIITETLDTILERTGDRPFLDTKFDVIDGRDYAGAAEPAFRSGRTVYAWIQGRGLEALAGHLHAGFGDAGCIRAVLRRSGGSSSARGEPQCRAYRFNGWTLDLTARHLRDPEGMVVNLSGAEFRLLQLLLEHPRQVLSRELLQEQGQGREAERSPFDRSLDVQICRLRARLRDKGREGGLIKTVRGDGYVFAADVVPEGVTASSGAEWAGA